MLHFPAFECLYQYWRSVIPVICGILVCCNCFTVYTWNTGLCKYVTVTIHMCQFCANGINAIVDWVTICGGFLKQWRSNGLCNALGTWRSRAPDSNRSESFFTSEVYKWTFLVRFFALHYQGHLFHFAVLFSVVIQQYLQYFLFEIEGPTSKVFHMGPQKALLCYCSEVLCSNCGDEMNQRLWQINVIVIVFIEAILNDCQVICDKKIFLYIWITWWHFHYGCYTASMKWSLLLFLWEEYKLLQWPCLYVGLSVHSHMSKTTCPNLVKFSLYVTFSMAWSSLMTVQCIMSHDGVNTDIGLECVWCSKSLTMTRQVALGSKSAIIDCLVAVTCFHQSHMPLAVERRRIQLSVTDEDHAPDQSVDNSHSVYLLVQCTITARSVD